MRAWLIECGRLCVCGRDRVCGRSCVRLIVCVSLCPPELERSVQAYTEQLPALEAQLAESLQAHAHTSNTAEELKCVLSQVCVCACV